ncbi:MAG: tail fiber domain-containing protein [Caldilineaceae bacterium]|jgi:hypothetical protein
MKAANDRKSTGQADSPVKKETYQSPRLQVFGKVYLVTQGSGGGGNDGGGIMTMQSDRSTKENVVRVGDHPLGIGLYLFDYKRQYRESKCTLGRQFGVMADEVEAVMPEAVSVHPNGYKVVNYSMLGIAHGVQ